jgi:hypothetical protein
MTRTVPPISQFNEPSGFTLAARDTYESAKTALLVEGALALAMFVIIGVMVGI